MQSKSILLAVFFASLAMPVLAQSAGRAHSSRPDGTGDPDATTCRPPQELAGSRFKGPEVCKLNSQWALLRKKGQDISADGAQIIPDPKGSGVAPMNCSAMPGGTSTGGGVVVCR